jgi:uncharacterized protein
VVAALAALLELAGPAAGKGVLPMADEPSTAASGGASGSSGGAVGTGGTGGTGGSADSTAAAGSIGAAGPTEADLDAVRRQLGRPPRSIAAVAHRCPCGLPDVVETRPRLEDGTPFPTLYYLTCPRAVSAIGTLEASGLMRQMSERLEHDPDLAAAYRAAHERYVARRERLQHVPEIAGVSAGGMPTRVKCLHVLVGQALAEGEGAQPLGDEALTLLEPWWGEGPCVDPGSE